MDDNETRMMESDYDELTDAGLVVLLLADGDVPLPKSRFQILSRLLLDVYDPEAVGQRFCDGYSDGIDEAVREMACAGILRKAGRGYALTDYGEGLKGLAMNECADARMVPGIGRLADAVAGIRDRSLAALEYHFYPGPVPMRFFDRLNSKAVYDGIPLPDYPKDEFERKLRSGEPIAEGARWSADTTYATSGWRRAVRTPSSATSG